MTDPRGSKKLLVYVPTFNRFDSVCRQVRALQTQILDLGSGHERILVVDNASTDPRYAHLTADIQNEFTVVERNTKQLGIVGNLIRGFSADLDWDYIWVVSDDDELSPRAISAVRAAIEESAATCYHLIAGVKGDARVTPGMEFRSATDLFRNMSIIAMLGLVSANVYSSSITEYLPEMYLYGYTLFPHVAALACLAQRQDFRLVVVGGGLVKWSPGPQSYSAIATMASDNILFISELIPDSNARRAFVSSHLRNHGITHVGRRAVQSRSAFRKLCIQIGLVRTLWFAALWSSLNALRSLASVFTHRRRRE